MRSGREFEFSRDAMASASEKRRFLWPAAIAALIVFASSRPTIAAPDVVDIDKVGHFLVFGLLATLLCRLGSGWRAAGWALLAASAFGATDEWHQAYVPGRAPDALDWIADTLGAALAVSLYAGWGRYRRLLEQPIWRKRSVAAEAPREAA